MCSLRHGIAFLLAAVLLHPISAVAEPPVAAALETKNIAGMNSGARLECIRPDGSKAVVNFRHDFDASVLIMEDDSVSCALAEGDTTFVVALPKATSLERFSFINENMAARGELQIAVSNDHLPAASEKWTPVDGVVAFSRKRLFNLSLLGVEAKYVRLTFHVQHEGRIASFALYQARTRNTPTPTCWRGRAIVLL